MMRIGITYDLRADYLATGMSEEETAEFDSRVTIDAICDGARPAWVTSPFASAISGRWHSAAGRRRALGLRSSISAKA